MPDRKSWLSLLIGVIKLGYGDAFSLRNTIEVEMIEVAHFSAFVFAPFEEFTLGELERSLVE